MALVSNKIQRQLSTTKFPPEFDVKVDKKKISFGVLQKWAEKRIEELIGFEDEILVDTLFNKLTEGSEPNIKETQLLMTEMLREHTAGFCLELWKLILSAQESEGGVPKELVAAKREQIEKERIEEAKALQAAIGRQAAEHKHEQSMNRIRDRERLDRRGARNDPSDNRTRSLSRHSRTRSKSPSLPRYPKRSHPPSHSRSPPRYRARRYPSSRSRSPSRRHQDREYSYSRSKSSSHRRRRYSRSRSRSPSRRRGHKRHSYSRSRSHSRRRQYRHYSSSRSRSPHRRRYDRYFSRSRSRDFRRYRRQSPTPPPRLRHHSPQYWREGDPFVSDVPRRNTSNSIIPSSGPDDRKGDEDYGDDDGDYGEGDKGDEEGDHGNNDRIDNNGAGKNGANNADAINDSAHSDGAHDNGADNAGAGNNDDATNGGAVNDGGVNKDSPPE